MLILGIESSCDETAAAVVQDGRLVLSNVVASQTHLHSKYGGVVPEIACRAHIEAIIPTIEEALGEAGIAMDDIDAVAVANRPGLIGALLIGLTAAKSIAWAHDLPLVAVNHLHAHLYANTLHEPDIGLPLVGLIVSGGHTSIVLCRSLTDIETLGSTTDDAAGEAFDKVSKIMELGYPGGPVIDRLAREGDPRAFDLPRSYLEPGSLDFSFSGIKTAVLYAWRGQPGRTRGSGSEGAACPEAVPDMAASFQEAVVEVLVDKLFDAAKRHEVSQIAVGGGVACNSRLREALTQRSESENITLHVPPLELCTDNAAMVAGFGYHSVAGGRLDPLDIDAFSRA